MSLQSLIDEKIVREFEGASLSQIRRRLDLAFYHLNNARKGFKPSAKKNINQNMIIYKGVYDSMRIGAEAYLLLEGCKAEREDHHKLVIKATKDFLGNDGLNNVFIRWDRMRKTRNNIDYDIDIKDLSNQSIEQSIKDSEKLLNKINTKIEEKSSQEKLEI